MATAKTKRSVGLRLRTNDHYGGWPATAHYVDGVPGDFYPDRVTPIDETGIDLDTARRLCADERFPLELVEDDPAPAAPATDPATTPEG